MFYIKNIYKKLNKFFKNMVQQIKKGSCAYILCTIFIGFCIINILWPSKTFSDTENRNLSGLPQISATNVISGKFMSEFDSYCDDQLIFRDLWVSLKANMQLLTFKKENNGVYKSKDSYFINKPQYDEKIANKNIETIKKVSAGGGLKVSVAIVPTAYEILTEKLPDNTEDDKLISNLKGLNSGFDGSNVNVIDVYNTLKENKDEYIYYRTDHHQTALGSFLVYKEIAQALELSPYREKDFNITDRADDFLGTNYSKFMIRTNKKDVISQYELKDSKLKSTLTIPEINKEYKSLFVEENLKIKDKYTYYMGGNYSAHIVKTNAGTGKKLVVFKDSYAHSIVPFLANHYAEIHMIDLRYFNDDVFEYMYKNKLSNILVLYNTSNFASDGSLSKLLKQEEISPYGKVRYGYVEYTDKADDSYFNDAVFVGDSLTEGMRMYSGIEGGHFYTKVGVSLYNADSLTDVNGINIFESLKTLNAGKMYIMLGINQELDELNLKNYIKMYGEFIDKVRKVDDDITIYIQAIMPISKGAEKRSSIYAKDILNANKALNRLAIDKCCYYLGVNEIAVDESGYMMEGISPDGIHLSAEKCQQWYDYLKYHRAGYTFNDTKNKALETVKFSGNSKIDCDRIAQDIIKELNFTYNMNKVSNGMIYDIYRIETEKIKSASIYMSSGALADEVAVFELDQNNGLSSEEVRDGISLHIEDRIKQMEGYNPKEVQKLKKAFVYSKDGVIVLCVSQNPETIKTKIDKILSKK